VGGLIVPFIGIKVIDLLLSGVWTGLRRNIMKNILRPAFVVFFGADAGDRHGVSPGGHRHCAVSVSGPGEWQPDHP
jgi:hypothetical protein